jgi:3-deoxy-D-manno-octulosonic-acid transferase
VLAHFRWIAAGSEEDARRFRELGFAAETTGNLKFDVAADSPMPAAERAQLRADLGFGDDPRTLVLLGSSTWPGEETFLIRSVRLLRDTGADVRLLLVPRHSERRADVAAEASASGLAWHQRSSGGAVAPAGTIIHLADTTGELRRLTRSADFAFCGKSLPPHEGGQTPVECAAAGVAIVYGPRMTNFRDICRGLEKAGAAFRVEDAAMLYAPFSSIVTALVMGPRPIRLTFRDPDVPGDITLGAQRGPRSEAGVMADGTIEIHHGELADVDIDGEDRARADDHAPAERDTRPDDG